MKPAEKSVLRQHFRNLRKQLAGTQRFSAQAKIAEHVIFWIQEQRPNAVAVYRAVGSEVVVESIRSFCHDQGIVVLLPICLEGGMKYSELSPDSQFQKDFHGITVPIFPKIRERQEMQNWRILTLVPGISFDRFGGRLGQGAGHYDRFLASRLPGELFMGVGFEVQISAEKLPRDEWDMPMDYLLSEIGIKQMSCE
jgi:5-formyltetrahydrofolate cyclo-ligase